MGGFLRALRSELYLAVRGRGLRLLVLLPAAAAIARIALGRLRGVTEEARDVLAGESGATAVELNAHGPFVDGALTGLTLGYLIVAAVAAHAIASDRDTGVIRHLLVRSVGRLSLVMSKFVFLVLFGLALFLAAIVAAWGTAALFYEFTAVVESGYEIIGVDEMRDEILRGLGLAIAPLPAAVGFGLVLSLSARSATGAVATALGLTFGFDLFKELLGDVSYYVYAFHNPSLNDKSYLGGVSQIVRGYSDVFFEEGVLQLNALVPVPATLVFLVVAMAIAGRRRM